MNRLLFIFLVASTFIGNVARAQNTVQVTINVLPPYSAYLQDYAGRGQQVQIFVRNTTPRPLSVRLEGSMVGDNGITIATQPNYRPPQALLLGPLENKLLTRLDLESLFDLNQISVQGIDKARLYRGLPLPDGNYQLCVRAFDYNTALAYSSDQPLGCSPPIPVKAVEPPILIAPLCDSDVSPIQPQNVVFTWTPPVGVSPANVQYTLRIVELPLENVDPNVFIDAVALPKSGVEVRGLRANSFLYSPQQPPLIAGKRYAWRVQALDPQGRINFLNDGKAPVCSFLYGVAPVEKKQIIVQSKKNTTGKVVMANCPGTVESGDALQNALQNKALNNSLKKNNVALGGKKNSEPQQTTSYLAALGDTVLAGDGQNFFVSWRLEPQFLSKLAQALGAGTDSTSVRGIVQKIPGARYEVSFTEAGGGLPVWNVSSTNEYFAFSPDSLGFGLTFAKRYSYAVRLVLPADVLAKLNFPNLNVLQSEPCGFYLKRKPKTYDDVVVRGVLRYEFDGKPGTFPAPNTELQIRFPMGAGQPDRVYFGKSDELGLFQIPIPGKDQVVVAAQNVAPTLLAARKANKGMLDPSAIPANIQFQFKTTNKRYQDPIQTFALDLSNSPDSLNIGLVTLKIYSYRLKLMVAKGFDRFYTLQYTGIDDKTGEATVGSTTYKIDSTLSKIDKTVGEPMPDVKMYVYRKQRPADLPPVEGQLGAGSLDAMANGYQVIAQGVTGLETGPDGKTRAVVTFDRLLPQVKSGDEYYITAAPDPSRNIAPAQPGLAGQNMALTPGNGPTNLNGGLPKNAGMGNVANNVKNNNVALAAQNGQVTIQNANQNGVGTNAAQTLPGANSLNTPFLSTEETFVAPEDTISVSITNYLTLTDLQNSAKAGLKNVLDKDAATSAVNGAQVKVTPGGQSKPSDAKGAKTVAETPDTFGDGAKYPIIKKLSATYLDVLSLYQLRTSKPPTSQLKGRLTYTWPNRSEKFVLANARFRVRIAYKIDGKLKELGTVVTEDAKGNKTIKSTFIEGTVNTQTADGKGSVVLSTEDDGFVAATGKTDADGNFIVNPININQKGDLNISGKIVETITILEKPPYKEAEKKKTPKQVLEEKYNAKVNPNPYEYNQSSQFGQFDQQGLQQYDLTNGVEGAINGSTGGFQGGYQGAAGAFGSQGKALSAGTGGMGSGGGEGGGGPWAPDAPLRWKEDKVETPIGSVERFYAIDIESPFYKDPKKEIVVQAFASGNVGEVRTDVAQWEGSPKVTYANGSPVKGAHVVVYRETDDKYALLPMLEGDGLQKKQRLPISSRINPSVGGMPTPHDRVVQWIADGYTNAEGKIDLNGGKWTGYTAGNALLVAPWAYRFYVLADAEQDVPPGQEKNGGYFHPKIQKGNPNFGVEQASSRLIVRLVDTDKNSDYIKNKGNLLDNKDPQQLSDAQFSTGVAGSFNLEMRLTPNGPWIFAPSKDKKYFTAEDGYVEVDLGAFAGPDKSMVFRISNVTVPGYSVQTSPFPIEFTSYGSGQQVVKLIQMQAGALVTGRVKGSTLKNGQITVTDGIPAYIRRVTDDAIFEAGQTGFFQQGVRVPSSGTQKLEIIPRDPGYFSKTITLPAAINGKISLDDIVLPRRLHKMQFKILNDATNQPIAGVGIFIGDVKPDPNAQNSGITATSNASGLAELVFENVSVNNYTVKAYGTAGGKTLDLVDQIFELKNAESEDYAEYVVRMRQGITIKGTTTLNGPGNPLAGVKVYVDYKAGQENLAPELGEIWGQLFALNAQFQQNPTPELAQKISDMSKTLPAGDDKANVYTYSDAQGKFELKGVPFDPKVGVQVVSVRGTIDPKNVQVISKSVIGAIVPVTIVNGGPQNSINLNLRLMPGGGRVQSALGFPITVEEAKPDPNDATLLTVTGLLDIRKSQSGFQFLSNADVVRVRNVKFKTNGTQPATLVGNSLTLEGISGLTFNYAGRYNVEIGKPADGFSAPAAALVLKADGNGRGRLVGKVQLVDNSFNFPSTYLNFQQAGQFYLTNTGRTVKTGGNGGQINLAQQGIQAAQQGIDNNAIDNNLFVKPSGDDAIMEKPDMPNVDNQIEVLTAYTNDADFNPYVAPSAPTQRAIYGIGNPNGGPLNFSFLQFPAVADPLRSYIDPTDGKIHLNMWLHCNIPNSQPGVFDVGLEDVVIDNNQVYPKKGSRPLNLKFEAWTLQVRDWTLDVKEGGIVRKDEGYSGKIVMKTQQVDIPFAEFVLRPDIFRLKTPDLKNLPVGGIATLTVNKPETAIWTYDTFFSGEGHWKLAIPANGNQPAALLDLSKSDSKMLVAYNTQYNPLTQQNTTSPSATIAFNYVQLLSNDQTLLSLKEKQTLRVMNNPLADFAITGFQSGSGFVNVVGRFSVKDAPRVPDVQMQVSYTAGAPARYSPLAEEFTFETKGHTTFTATPLGEVGAEKTNLLITSNTITIPGTVVEEGQTPTLNAEFWADASRSNPYYIKVLKQEGVVLNPGQTKAMLVDVVEDISAEANAQDWLKPLFYRGYLYEKDQSVNAMMKRASASLLRFDVYGDMHVTQADTKGVKLEGISTPFGEMKLAFTFSPFSMAGSLDVSKDGQPVDMGAVQVQGMANMLVDGDGFLVVASLLAQGDVIPPPIQGINLGIAVGRRGYRDSDKVVLLAGTQDPLALCKIGDGVSGFYVTGTAILFHKEVGVDFVLAEAWAKANVALYAGARLKVGDGASLLLTAGATAQAEAGIRVVCASAVVNVQVVADLTGKIETTLPPQMSSLPGISINALAAVGASLKVSACGFGSISFQKWIVLNGNITRPSGGPVKLDVDVSTGDSLLGVADCQKF